MLQVAMEVLSNPEDSTEISLIFANQTEKDIILREELDTMAAKHKNFKVSFAALSFGACPWNTDITSSQDRRGPFA